ncbi:MAG: hypothetical protein HYX66_03865 [Ignavibacteria bacterium]|nr:hypothetical protein [Ignavibacteria bacterium]
MKYYFVALAFAAFAAVSAHAIAPTMITFSCVEGKAPGWIVYEDRNGDGNMDWQTVRGCNNVILSGPFPPPVSPPPLPREIIASEPPTSFDFSSSSCGSNMYSWEVVEKNGSGDPTANINQDCYENVVISYPAIIDRPQGSNRGDANPKLAPRNLEIDINIFPNPTSSVVNLSGVVGKVNIEEEYTVVVVDPMGRTRYLARVFGSQLLKDYTIDTSLLTTGGYSIAIHNTQGEVIAQAPLSIIK